MKRSLKFLFAALLAFCAGATRNALACAACYGQSDAPMAQGMNWGILVLLGIIGLVLTCITAFFVYIAKKTGKPDNG